MIFLKGRATKALVMMQVLTFLSGTTVPAYAATAKKAGRFLAMEDIDNLNKGEIEALLFEKRTEMERIQDMLTEGTKVEMDENQKALYYVANGAALIGGLGAVASAVMMLKSKMERRNSTQFQKFKDKFDVLADSIETKTTERAGLEKEVFNLNAKTADVVAHQERLHDFIINFAKDDEVRKEQRKQSQVQQNLIDEEIESLEKARDKLNENSKGQAAKRDKIVLQINDAAGRLAKVKENNKLIIQEAEDRKAIELGSIEKLKVEMKNLREQAQKAAAEVVSKERRTGGLDAEIAILQERLNEHRTKVAKFANKDIKEVDGIMEKAVWKNANKRKKNYRQGAAGLTLVMVAALVGRHFTKSEGRVPLTEEEYFKLNAIVETLNIEMAALNAASEK